MEGYHQPCRPRGPVGVWGEYLVRLGVEQQGNAWKHIPTGDESAWRSSEWGKVTHFLRNAIRWRLLERAARKRGHFEGAPDSDIGVTTKIIRDRTTTHQGELYALLSDGIWTQRRRAAAGWVEQATCPFCDWGVEENLEHPIHECPAWGRFRTWSLAFSGELKTQSRAARLCTWTVSQRGQCADERRMDSVSGGVCGYSCNQGHASDLCERGRQEIHQEC